MSNRYAPRPNLSSSPAPPPPPPWTMMTTMMMVGPSVRPWSGARHVTQRGRQKIDSRHAFRVKHNGNPQIFVAVQVSNFSSMAMVDGRRTGSPTSYLRLSRSQPASQSNMHWPIRQTIPTLAHPPQDSIARMTPSNVMFLPNSQCKESHLPFLSVSGFSVHCLVPGSSAVNYLFGCVRLVTETKLRLSLMSHPIPSHVQFVCHTKPPTHIQSSTDHRQQYKIPQKGVLHTPKSGP